ncbi:MAG: hypothetical protein ACI8P2_001815 [Candidatus Latescibacterota bacterium]|jgi:hypothetical protein
MDEGLLSSPPTDVPTIPDDSLGRAALGYLNCAHCHHQRHLARDGGRCFDPENDLDFSLTAASYDEPGDKPKDHQAIEPGHPDKSTLIELVSRRGWRLHMPLLSTEKIDRDAVDLLTRSIFELGQLHQMQ